MRFDEEIAVLKKEYPELSVKDCIDIALKLRLIEKLDNFQEVLESIKEYGLNQAIMNNSRQL